MSKNEFTFTFFKNDKKIFEKNYKNEENDNNIFRFNVLDFNTIIDTQNELFKRENDDFLFFLDHKNNKCTVELKKEHLTFPIGIDFCDITNSLEEWTMEYSLETIDERIKIVLKR